MEQSLGRTMAVLERTPAALDRMLRGLPEEWVRSNEGERTWSAFDIVVHLIQGNDFLCGAIGGAKAPARGKIAATDTKAALTARLRETFQFCDQALATLDDSKLSEQLPMFGGKTMPRAAVELLTVGDWADHYSQMANYLRLNNLLPPTAKK